MSMSPRALQELLHRILNNNMEILDLDGQSISAAQMEVLAQAIAENTSLKVLDLTRTGWESNSKQVESIANILTSNKSIAHLSLMINQFGSADIKIIAEALSRNITLTDICFYHNQSIGREGFLILAKVFAAHPTITSIDLGAIGIGLPELELLTDILIKNRTIKSLNLRESRFGPGTGDLIAKVLLNNSSLTEINLDYNALTFADMKAIAEALKVNNTLNLIELYGNNLNPEGAKLIAEILQQNKTITSMDIGHNNFGLEGIRVITDALGHNKTLTTLKLGGENFGADEIKFIAEGLKHNTTLTTLVIDEVNLEATNLMQSLAEGLRVNTALTTLNLQNANIDADGAKILAEMLQQNTTLTEIDLRWNTVTFPTADDVMLEINSLLQRNKIIQGIRKDIQSLSPTAPIASKDKDPGDSKGTAEIDFQKLYQSILATCTALEKQGCAAKIVETLRAEATFNYCCWEPAEMALTEHSEAADTVDAAFTPDKRIQTLQKLCKTDNVNFKKQVLSEISTIAMHQGLLMLQKAKAHFLLAYTAAQHGEKDNSADANRALNFWLNKELSMNEAEGALELALLQSDPDKFKELKNAYERQCQELYLNPRALGSHSAGPNNGTNGTNGVKLEHKRNAEACVVQFEQYKLSMAATATTAAAATAAASSTTAAVTTTAAASTHANHHNTNSVLSLDEDENENGVSRVKNDTLM